MNYLTNILSIIVLGYFVLLISTYIFQRNLLYHPKINNYYGHELSVLKGLSKIIKRDKPALIIETGDDIKIIEKNLKKYGFKKYSFSNKYNKFMKIKKNYPLNTYFLQKNHLKLNVT